MTGGSGGRSGHGGRGRGGRGNMKGGLVIASTGIAKNQSAERDQLHHVDLCYNFILKNDSSCLCIEG